MRTPAATRIALGSALEGGRRVGDLRLRSGDEGRQTVDPAVGDHRLGLRLRLVLGGLRTLAVLARLTLLARFALLAGFTLLARFALLTRFAVFARLTLLARFAWLLLIALVLIVVGSNALIERRYQEMFR